MGVLKLAVVVAVIAGLTVNLWTRRGLRRGKKEALNEMHQSVRARSAAYGDALMIQCLVMVICLLMNVPSEVLGVLLAGVVLTVAAFWMRHKVLA